MSDPISPAAAAATKSRTAEKTAWWITFGVLALAIVTMLGLWN